jgi:predicted O-methyltransferase YrrM
MKFTTDWFESHKSTWKSIVPGYKPTKILEIGSYEGQSICYLIDMLGRDVSLEIYCLDTWAGGQEHVGHNMAEVESNFDSNIQEACLASGREHKVYKIKGDSLLGLSSLITQGKTNYFDMVYVDGSHETPDVFGDAVLSYRLLRLNGLMIFDDYVWGAGVESDPLRNPKLAIDSFLNCFQRKVQPHPWMPLCQLYCRKIA